MAMSKDYWSSKPIFVCKECGNKCKYDEINYENVCIDCVDYLDVYERSND